MAISPLRFPTVYAKYQLINSIYWFVLHNYPVSIGKVSLTIVSKHA